MCPCNVDVDRTDFRAIQAINLCESCASNNQPVWEFKNEGKEIHQNINSNAGIAIGDVQMSNLDFEGTIFVANDNTDDDWIGTIFSFQV